MLAFALNGCSPPRAVIRTQVIGDDLVFTATISTGPFFHHKVDLQSDLVRVDHEGRIVWRIERRHTPGCLNYGAGGSSAVFPLTYGKVPPCFTQVVAPQPLTANTIYRIAAVGGSRRDNGLGYFRTGLAVKDLDSEPSGVASWGETESVYNVAASASPENTIQPEAPSTAPR